MININDFKIFLFNVANKNGRGTITPSQFNSFAEQGLMAWYNQKIGMKDSNGVPISMVDINQLNIEDLNDIREERRLLSHLGTVLIPDGTTYDLNGDLAPAYWTFGSLTFDYHQNKNGEKSITERPIEIVKDNEWGKRTSSTIVAPNMKRPIAKFLSGKLSVRPKALTSVNLTYLRYPKVPVWNYTIVNGRPVYDSASSVDMEAPKEAFNNIAMLCLGFMGINLREQDLVQYANLNENKGI